MAKPKELHELKWAGKVPRVQPGKYKDGLPFREIEYLCCKLILKPDRFISRESMFGFNKVLKETASRTGVKFDKFGLRYAPLKIREVIFFDTHDFRLYNNAFILRRRVTYIDGFPTGDPEIVFKFRHSDLQKAAETDVRPNIKGDYRIKFKCQALPLKDQLGGVRMLYSHNIQFPRSRVPETEVSLVDVLIGIFPALKHLRKDSGEKIKLVNDVIVEEILQDIGILDFGQGVTAVSNISLWRTRGEHKPLIGEFSFQLRFRERDESKLKAMKRMETFFIDLQYNAQDWIALDATKTGIIYRMLGNPPTSHE